MPNWCFNEFHIDIDGDRTAALDVVKRLSDDASPQARDRLTSGNKHLRDGEFPFEPLEVLQPPAGMVDATPGITANLWRDRLYPEFAREIPLREQIMTALLQGQSPQQVLAAAAGTSNPTTPSPDDVAQADASALNLALFGYPNADALMQEKVGSAGSKAYDGRARIEEREDGSMRIVASVDSAWDQVGAAFASTLLEISDSITRVRAYWIEGGNDFCGAALADRQGKAIKIEESGCMAAYRQACKALGRPEPQPEEGEDEVQIDFEVITLWLQQRLIDLAQLRTKPASPSP